MVLPIEGSFPIKENMTVCGSEFFLNLKILNKNLDFNK